MSASSDAFVLATRGDFAMADRLSAEDPHPVDAADRAWRSAFESVRHSAAPNGPHPWSLEAVTELARDPAARPAAASICREAERAALLAFDTEALRSWCAIHATIEDADAPLRASAALWLDFAEGRFDVVVADARAVEGAAAKAGLGAVVVDAAALRALASLAVGAVDDALAVSRRASRMARTEAFPQSEYLAHLVLARVRRHSGHPHLATRILEALSRVAPRSWWPWLRIELALSGAMEISRTLDDGAATPSATRARDLVALLDAAESADRVRFDAAAATLRAPWPLLDSEYVALVASLDPEKQPPVESEAWCRGRTDEAPPILAGVLTRSGSAPEEDSALAYVVARPSDRRRIPRSAFGLTSRLGLTVLQQSRRKQGRVEMLTSLLALEPEGVDETRCFERVYGFPFEVELHKGVFDVLVHRTREYLGDAGRIVREDGRIQLVLLRSILVADPRCTKPFPDSLLRVVAQQRGATAKDIAAAAGVSLRAAQAALRDLTEAGACEAQKRGRAVHYVVEDTTFSEPTRRSPRQP